MKNTWQTPREKSSWRSKYHGKKQKVPSRSLTLAPEKLPKPNRQVVFQPPILRGELLNFGGVNSPHLKDIASFFILGPTFFHPRLLDP